MTSPSIPPDDGMNDLRSAVAGVYQDPTTPTTPQLAPKDGVEYWSGVIQAGKASELEQFGTSMRAAIKANPETAGLADSLARKMGMPLLKAQDDMGFLRAVSVMQRMRDDDIRSTSPVLYKSFQGLEFARKALDDYDALSWGESWARGWKSGGLTAERGRLAAKLWLSGGLEWDQATGSYKRNATDRMQRREDLARLEQIGVEQSELGPIGGFIGNAAQIAGQWADAVPRAVESGYKTAAVTGAASLLAGPASPVATPAATVGGFAFGFSAQYTADTFATMTGNAYADMVAAGYDPDRALVASVAYGIAGTALELGGLNIATSAVRQKIMGAVWKRAATEVATDVPSGFVRGYLGEYGKVIAAETGTELAQEFGLIVAEQLARRGGEDDMNPDGVASRLWEVASSTVQGMALLGVPGGLAGGFKGRVAAFHKLEQERAQAQRDHLKAAHGINPKMLERDPEAAADFMRQALRQGDGPQEAHLDAETFRTLLDKIDTEGAKSGVLRKSTLDVLEGIVPGISKQLEDAEATGGDVSLPVADLITRIRGELPEFEAAFSDVAKLDPTAPDADATTGDGKATEKAASEADTGSKDEAAFYTSLKEIERQTAASVVQAAGTRISPSQAQTVARTYAAMVEQVAREEKLDPQEAVDRYGIKEWLSAEEIPGDAMRQPSMLKTDTPEFKAWFGESKVVDDAGKPLVVYHAGSFDEAVDLPRRGMHFGTESAADERMGSAIVDHWLEGLAISEENGRWFWSSGNDESFEIRDEEGFDSEDAARSDAEWFATRNLNADDSEANKTKAFLSLRNPKRVKDQRTTAAWDVAISAAIGEGYDGLVYRNEFEDKGKDSYVAFRPEQIKSVNNRGTFDPNDPNILRQPGRGGFDLQRMAVMFTSGADVSTVMHELTHWFVEVVERLDAAGSAYGKAQLDNLLAHWKMTREQWAAMDLEQRRPLLEDIAYNAEEYFASGQAPSAELRGVFQKLRSFIVGVYGAVRSYLVGAYAEETGGAQLRAISPELRSFFDRMLAADSAIEIETATRQGAARLSDEAAKAIGIDADTLEEIRRLEQDRIDDAKAELMSEAVRGGRFFAAGRRNAEAAVKRKLAESTAKVRKHVEQQVDESPVYKALAFIRTGKVEVDGQEVSARLDTESVASILGDDASKLPGNMTRKGGVNPDLLARSFGFESGGAMLRAIINAPSKEAAIAAQVQQRLEAEEPLSNPKEFKRAVEEALHGKTAARLASTILRAMLGDGVKSSPQLEAEAREAARLVILRTPVGRINVRSFANAELRAMRARDKAIKSGDKAAAIEAMRRYLVQHYLTVEGAKAEREIERETATIAKRFEQPVDKLKDGRSLDVVQVAIAMLGKFGMVSAARHNAAVEYLSEWARLDPNGYKPYAVRLGMLVEAAVPMEQMTLDRFRVVTEAASGFWSEAKQSNYVRSRGKLVLKQQAQSELLDEVVDTFGKDDGSLPDFRPEEMTDWSMGAILANLTRLEAWTIKMDGGEPGAWHRYVYQPLKDAAVANEVEKITQHKWAADIMARHDAIKPLAGEEIDLQPVLGQGRNAVFKNRGEFLGALQHVGTEKGLGNLLIGNKLGTQPMPGATYEEVIAAASERWDRALEYAAQKGWLYEGDVALLQEQWDHIRDTIKDRLFTTTRDVWSFYPTGEKPRPVKTPFGTIPGGYFPSKVDKRKSTITADKQLSAIEQGEHNFREAHPSVPRGSVMRRGENVVQPRVTDIRLLTQHIDEAMNIIHLQPALSDVAGLFRGNVRSNEQLGMLREAMAQVAPFAERKIILPALERMARDSIVAPGDAGLAKTIGYLRQSASMAFLGFNPKNAALQFTGLANAVPQVGMGRLWGAFWSNWANPSKLVASIEEQSDAMRARWSAELQLLAQDMDRMLEPSALNDVRRQAAKAAFFLQRYAQMTVDALVWQAAHDKATAEGATADDAVTRADSAVRITQGEKSPLDVSQFLAGGAVAQLFTQFADYPNTVLNQNLAAPEGRRFAVFAWTVIAPALATSMIGWTLAFGKLTKGERDDDEYGRELLNHFVGDQVRGAFGLLPVAGPIIGSALNELFGLTNTPGGMRNTPFAGWSMVDTIYRIGSGRGGWSDWIMGAGLGLRLPVRPAASIARYEQNVEAGREDDGGTLDYLRVLLVGR